MKIIIILLVVVVLGGSAFFYFRKSGKHQREIAFEIQIAGAATEPVRVSLVNNDRTFAGTGSLSETSRIDTDSGLTLVMQPTLLTPGEGENALVVETGLPLAQVFELPADASEQFEWSPWLSVSFFENAETAVWTFMEKVKTKRVAADPASPLIKIRYKSRAINVEQEFKEHQAAKKALVKQEIARLRSEFSKGNKDIACQLVLLDPHATEDAFLVCKEQIESQKDIQEKWKLLVLFKEGPEGRDFVSWYNNEYSEDPNIEQDWSHKKTAIPSNQQVWFLTTFFETWMKLEDQAFLVAMPNVRHSIDNMRFQQWSPESLSYVRDQLPTLLKTRLEKITIKNEKTNWNPDITWNFEIDALMEVLAEKKK